jgi:Protein of unknown function (DUF3106)
MVKGTYESPSWWQPRHCLGPLLLGAMIVFSSPHSGHAGGFAGRHGRLTWYGSPAQAKRPPSDAPRTIQLGGRGGQRSPAAENGDHYDSLSPQERARLRERYRQWESLPPEKQQDLRRRMDRFKELPPDERELLRKRHEQWQELPPQERQSIRDQLRRWNQLSPEEQERLRQQFRRQ